jgi:hypothetical protein
MCDHIQTLYKSAQILVRQGHLTLGSKVMDVANGLDDLSDQAEYEDEDVDETDDDNVPLDILFLRDSHQLTLQARFEQSTDLVDVLDTMNLEIQTFDKTTRLVPFTWTITLRETWKYFIPLGVDGCHFDLRWTPHSQATGVLYLSQRGEHREISGLDIVKLATQMGTLTHKELQFLVLYSERPYQVFLACLAILLGRNHFPQCEFVPATNDCLSGSFSLSTKDRLSRLLGTRKLALGHHVVYDDNEQTHVVLFTPWDHE